MDQRCENCRFVRRSPNTGKATFFTCVRYPPHAEHGHPSVARAGWCGEYKARSNPEHVHELPSQREPRLTPEQARNARIAKQVFEPVAPDEGPDPDYGL